MGLPTKVYETVAIVAFFAGAVAADCAKRHFWGEWSLGFRVEGSYQLVGGVASALVACVLVGIVDYVVYNAQGKTRGR